MNLSPDGWFYLAAARGEKVPVPYSRRWFLPRSLGASVREWVWCTRLSLAVTPLLAWWYFGAMGLDGLARVFATALLCVLPGVWRCSARFPVLLDAPSFALALWIAWATKTGPWWYAGALALVGGATRETVPVFAALWCWHPLPLVGLVASGWWRKSAPSDIPWLTHPVREAVALRRRIGLDGGLYLRPFGAALAGLAAPSWQVAVTVAVAHLQLLAAQDTIRLTVWCAPVLVLGAAKSLPVAWWGLALLWSFVQTDDRV